MKVMAVFSFLLLAGLFSSVSHAEDSITVDKVIFDIFYSTGGLILDGSGLPKREGEIDMMLGGEVIKSYKIFSRGLGAGLALSTGGEITEAKITVRNFNGHSVKDLVGLYLRAGAASSQGLGTFMAGFNKNGIGITLANIDQDPGFLDISLGGIEIMQPTKKDIEDRVCEDCPADQDWNTVIIKK
jgi:hypothetical protein